MCSSLSVFAEDLNENVSSQSLHLRLTGAQRENSRKASRAQAVRPQAVRKDPASQLGPAH